MSDAEEQKTNEGAEPITIRVRDQVSSFVSREIAAVKSLEHNKIGEQCGCRWERSNCQ